MERPVPTDADESRTAVDWSSANYSAPEISQMVNRARGVSGNVLVKLVKSRISEKPVHIRNLNALKLYRIDDVAIGPNEGWFIGRVVKVAHLVSVTFLVETVEILPVGSISMSDTLEHEMESQADGSRSFRDGEYIEWHKENDSRSLIWSTPLALQDLLLKAESVFGKAATDSRGLVDFDGLHSEPTTARDAFNAATKSPDRVTFLRIEYPGSLALVWTPSPGTEAFDRVSDFGEASLIFDRNKVDVAASAIQKTATRRIGNLATKIVGHVAA